MHMIDLTVVIGQLKIVVHLNGVKGAELGTIATVHADVGINVEFSRLWNGFAGIRIVCADNPDTLGGTNLGTNSTTGATILFSGFIPIVTFGILFYIIICDQKRNKAEIFGYF